MDRPERALVVTPHPDDAEGGCGGTIGRWVREGTRVAVVLCTNGDKGTEDREMSPERLAATRETEQADASRTLGVEEVIYLRNPDGGLEDTYEFRGQLVRALRSFKPDVVLCPDPHRRTFYLHRDHRICGMVTLDAVFPYARDHLHYPEHSREGLETHKVGDVLLWATEEPDTWIDVTETVDLKIESLTKHASQISSAREVDEWVKNDARAMGKMAEMEYAEAFRRIAIRR